MAEKDENNDALQNHSDQTCGGERIAHSSTHTAVDGDTDPEEILVEEIEIGGVRFGGNAYHDTYRNGNFGVKRGRVNFTRAKIWSFAHLFTACTIIGLGVGCIVLLTENHWYWIYDGVAEYFVVVSPLCGFFGLLTSCGGIYLSSSHAKLRRPLFVLLLVRLLALLECLLVFSAIICTTIVASKAKSENPRWPEYRDQDRWRYPPNSTIPPEYISKRKPAFTGLCGGLVISMVVDWITALAWLFHWWRYCVCCQCFKSCCIFEPGEPLAPGVSDPPTGFLRECVYVFLIAIRSCSEWSLI